LLFIFSNYHFFFGRLALADPLSSSLVLVAFYFAYRLKIRVAYREAALCGLFLFLAFVAKTNAIPFFCIPVFAALFFWSRQRPATQHLRWLATALLVGLGLSAIFVILLRLRGYDYFFSSFAFAVGGRYSATSAEATSLLNIPQILDNLRIRVEMLVAYSGWGYIVVSIASMLVCLWKRQWFLLSVLLIPSAVLMVSGVQESRYWFAPLALLLLAVTSTVVTFTRHYPRNLGVLIGLAVWGVVTAVPLWVSSYQAPLEMPLDELDKREYIYADGAGSALDEVIAFLETRQPSRVLGALANCDGLRYRAWQKLPIECLKMSPSGEDADDIAAVANSINDPSIYLVLETSPYAPPSVEGIALATFERPTGLASLTIYQLSK
jgi:hypothetical protein